MSTNGFVITASDKDKPGTVTFWQKYCIFGTRPNVNKNLLGCNGLGLLGLRVSAVIKFS
jgi:hypothetical protein